MIFTYPPYKKSPCAKDERLRTITMNSDVLPVSVRYRIQASWLPIRCLSTCQEICRQNFVGGYSHLDCVFLMVVNKGNRLIPLRGAVDGHTHCAIANLPAQNSDVVDRFPIPVVHREALTICREERCETQAIHASAPGVIPRSAGTSSRPNWCTTSIRRHCVFSLPTVSFLGRLSSTSL